MSDHPPSFESPDSENGVAGAGAISEDAPASEIPIDGVDGGRGVDAAVDASAPERPVSEPPAAVDAPASGVVGAAGDASPFRSLPPFVSTAAPPSRDDDDPVSLDIAEPELPGTEESLTASSASPPPPASAAEGLPVLTEPKVPTDPAPAPMPADAPAETLPAAPGFRARPLPRAIAVANQKGGVGKTTTAVNLGAGLAELGYRVLVVDLDPQGNATTGLGVNPRNLTGSVYDVLMNDAPLEDCVEPTAMRNLFVVPATIDLAGAEIELVPAFSRELKLRRAIDSLDGDFDFTLIDCPPSLGLLTVNGLAAAGEVLVPIQCEYYALEGLGQLIKNIQLVQSNLNPRLELSTIVLTMYDARTRLSDQVAKEVREHFGAKVCRSIVPRTVRLSEAPSFGQPINVFDPSSRGATAYRELAKEVSGGAARRSG